MCFARCAWSVKLAGVDDVRIRSTDAQMLQVLMANPRFVSYDPPSFDRPSAATGAQWQTVLWKVLELAHGEDGQNGRCDAMIDCGALTVGVKDNKQVAEFLLNPGQFMDRSANATAQPGGRGLDPTRAAAYELYFPSVFDFRFCFRS